MLRFTKGEPLDNIAEVSMLQFWHGSYAPCS